MSQLPIGKQAPEFELTGLNGRVHRLTEALANGSVALIFYKASCPTSQFTLPYVEKIYSRPGNASGVTFWGVSQDDPDETRQFAKTFGITFDLLVDDYPYAVSTDYGLEFVPAIFLIQPDRKIISSDFGFTKAGLNRIAGFEFFTPNDGLPATRPG